MTIKVFLHPDFTGTDKGDGGIRRVVEAQRRHLPDHGIELVDDVQKADLIATHILVDKPILRTDTRVPLVVHNHGLYWTEYDWDEGIKPEYANWCIKVNAECLKAIRMADAVTSPSEWVAQALRRSSLRRVVPIGHGIEAKEWPAPRPRKQASYVLWNKTRPDAVCDPEPVNILAKRVPGVKFVTTFGDKSLANVEVTGRVPYERAKQYVRKASVYLCTPRETFGIGTIEAMAAGVPILGWRWGGQAEFIEHKVTGWLSKPGDYDDLMRGLSYCLEHRVRMGQAARKVALAQYQWKDIIGAYADLYRETLEATRREHPKISVILPAYKLAEHLPAAIASVRAQTEQDWECIIVDDASPDKCGEIADAAAADDPRFKVVHNEENLHVAGTLNAGAAVSTGRYLLPLDADNTLPRRTLEYLARALDKDRAIDIAYGNVLFRDLDGKEWHSGWPPEFVAEQQVLKLTKPGQIPANLIPSTALFRRRVWELTGGWRRRRRNGEDPDFWMRATSYGFVAKRVTEADTLVYLNRPDSLSRTETLTDWTTWFPWARQLAPPPSAIDFDGEVLVPSYEPLLVSVIIPVGPGHEELVIDALDSVDAQTFRLWECIVVNDTGKPLRYTPSWARVINTPGKVGVGAARNRGIAASKAALFLPLDADDTLEPDALTYLYAAHKEVGGVVYSDWYERWEGQPVKVWQTPEYDAKDLLAKGCIHAITALYVKADWERVGGFDEKVPAWEDWDYQLKMAEIGVCGTRIPQPLFTYRKDEGMRREDNYARFQENKEVLGKKWAKYVDGKETLMACRSCSKKKVKALAGDVSAGPTAAQRVRAATANGGAGAEGGEYAIIEYVGRKRGSQNFRGPSGTQYRFAADGPDQVKYVLAADAAYFLAKIDFRRGEVRQEA
jgi:glycosyltransferase involved in cell wall biosynthesis